MSNLLFTPASLSQQETVSGGAKTKTPVVVKAPVVVKTPVVLNLNLAIPIVIGSKNVTDIAQNIRNK